TRGRPTLAPSPPPAKAAEPRRDLRSHLGRGLGHWDPVFDSGPCARRAFHLEPATGHFRALAHGRQSEVSWTGASRFLEHEAASIVLDVDQDAVGLGCQ